MKATAVLVLLLYSGISAAAQANIATGDHLFLSAQVVECEEEKKRLIAYTEVDEKGKGTFFELEVSAAGRSGKVVAEELAQRIGAVTGRNPTTLKVTVVSASDEEMYYLLHFGLNRDIGLFGRCQRDKMKREEETEELRRLELFLRLAEARTYNMSLKGSFASLRGARPLS